MRPAGMHFLDGISGVYKYKKILRELSSVLLISTSFVKKKVDLDSNIGKGEIAYFSICIKYSTSKSEELSFSLAACHFIEKMSLSKFECFNVETIGKLSCSFTYLFSLLS